MLVTMTVLQKREGGVHGIATGTSLVAKTLARQFMEQVESTCAPFQFALSTRAGTDCVGHAIRVVTEATRHDSALYRRHWRTRSCLPQFDVVQVVGRPGSPEIAPLRAEGMFPTVTVRMGRP